MAMKKPKPPVPGRPKPTPAKKKPAPKVPVTSVTPRSTVKKPSAKQVAGTRKVVANLAGVTPVGRAAKIAKGLPSQITAARKISGKLSKITNYGGKAYVDMGRKPYANAPKIKADAYTPFGSVRVKGSKKDFDKNARKKLVADVDGYVPRNFKKQPSMNKVKTSMAGVKSVKSVAKKKKK
jgi:hypothetical protein